MSSASNVDDDVDDDVENIDGKSTKLRSSNEITAEPSLTISSFTRFTNQWFNPRWLPVVDYVRYDIVCLL